MPTANENINNATIRHAVQIQRFIREQIESILAAMHAADIDINAILRDRLPVLPRSAGFRDLAAALQEVRNKAFRGWRDQFSQVIVAFGQLEQQVEIDLLSEAVPIDHGISQPSLLSRGAIFNHPIQIGENASATVNDLFREIIGSDRRRILQAIRVGLQNGEGTDRIIRRLRGTQRNGFKDGVYETTRRNAEALVRTVVNDVSNTARDMVFDANSNIIVAKRWVSTLDHRTSSICRFRDGALDPVGDNVLPRGAKRLQPPGARPPAHVNCRSVLVALLSLDSVVGERPFVRGERLNFRQVARSRVGQERWRGLTEEQRRRHIRRARQEWLDQNVGTVPATETYYEWFAKQSSAFQDDVLGPTRGRLYRSGRISLEQLHDRFGNPLTLQELQSRLAS